MVDGFNFSNEITIAQGVDLGDNFYPISPVRELEDLGYNFILVEPFAIDFYTTTPYQWLLNKGLTDSEDTFITKWLLSLEGNNNGGGDGIFLNEDPTDVTVGALLENSVIKNKTWQEIISLMVYQEKFPVLTNPSFIVSTLNGDIFEVGIQNTIQFLLQYNMGSISPAYGTNGFRSGPVIKYMLGTTNIPYQSLNQQYNLPINYNIPFNITFSFYADRLIGPQPLSNKGNVFNNPYPAGSFVYYKIIYFVYPIYSTFTDISVTTKMHLQKHDSEYFETEMVAENLLGNKQIIEFSVKHLTIRGIKQFNTFSNTWEWINGSKVSSLNTFNITNIQKNINGNTVNYIQYTHNGPTIGHRKLRFYTT